MKHISIYLGVGIICVLLLLNSFVYGQYFYSNGGPIPLGIDSSKVSIKFENLFTQDHQLILLAQIERIGQVLIDQETADDFLVCELTETGGYDGFIDSLETVNGIESAEPYYIYDGTVPCPVGETFFVAFSTVLAASEIDSINSEFNVDIVEKVYGTESIYLLKKLPISDSRILDIANAYFEMNEVIFAHPNFGVKFETHSYKLYDFYHTYQDHLKKVIGDFNNLTVWDFAGL